MKLISPLCLALLLFKTSNSFNQKIAPLFRRNSSSKPVCFLSNNDIDRIESIKSAFISTVFGSIGYLPLGLLSGILSNFSPQWEFDSDVLAISLALFGITYRYTIRDDDNDQLKQGAIGAFALTRTFSMIRVSDTCTSIPLNCGPPFGYFDFQMIFSGLSVFIVSFIAYSAAGLAIDNFIEAQLLEPRK